MNNKKKFEIYKVKDNYESYKIKKERIFDLPMRLNIVGKSEFSGKSNLIVNLLCRPEFYLNEFDGQNIFIISASLDGTDEKLSKLIEVKDIPPENLFKEFHEEQLDDLYNILEDDYLESIENNEKPSHKLIIFDDISFKGDLKKKQHGVVSKLFCNGRHILISTILTSQKATSISTTCRENGTGGIYFSCSDRQLEQVIEDHNKLDNKKQFKKMFRDITKQPFSFFVVNYSNPADELYLDNNFDKIDYNKYK